MTVNLKFTDLQFKAKLADLAQIKAIAMPQVYREFVKLTPIDTGNARNSTQLINNEIHANYPYADRLDTGYSDQAPDGMTHPAMDYAKRLIPQIVQQISNKRK